MCWIPTHMGKWTMDRKKLLRRKDMENGRAKENRPISLSQYRRRWYSLYGTLLQGWHWYTKAKDLPTQARLTQQSDLKHWNNLLGIHIGINLFTWNGRSLLQKTTASMWQIFTPLMECLTYFVISSQILFLYLQSWWHGIIFINITEEACTSMISQP